MRATSLEETLKHTPFRPFEIHADGRVIQVGHPEQVFVTPDRGTVIVGLPDGRIFIVDMDHISSLEVKSRSNKNSKS